MENRKISKLIRNQLPDFIRSEHGMFVTFLEKYYEWMEQSVNPLGAVEQLRNAIDIDTASNEYIESIYSDLLPYFPHGGMLSDKKMFLKHINDFYSRKGTQESLKLAFRAFYGEEAGVYYPKEDILKVSDGKWLLPLALRIDSDDPNFLNIEKTILTGLTSKATAIVERVIRSVDRQLGIEYLEVYISNIQKYFTTGEIVTATYYNDVNLPISVEGRLVGALSELKINPKYRGLYYSGYDADTLYDGDPVTIVGGLNPTATNPVGAVATVGETTKGAVVDVLVTNGGLGFRLNDSTNTTSRSNTTIDFRGGYAGSSLINAIQEAKAEITILDESVSRNVSITSTTIQDIYTDSIANVANIYGSIVDANTADPASNAVNTMSQYESLTLYPISFVNILGGGGGYREKPEIDVYSFYNSDLGENIIGTEDDPKLFAVARDSSTLTTSYTGLITVYNVEKGDLIRFVDLENRTENIKEVASVTQVGIDGGLLNTITVTEPFPVAITGLKAYKLNKRDIRSVGSLGRLEIVNPGASYNVGDKLVFSGGTGYGANANVTSVSVLGEITGVDIQYHSANAYIRGGEGYSMDSLPTITVLNSNGDVAGDGNASIIVTEILGEGEILDLSTTRIGSISTLRISSYGYDYIKAPKISLRNMDVTATNVSAGRLFVANTVVYQGSSNTVTTFKAWVDRYEQTTGFLRLFDYQGNISNTAPLISDDGLVSANVDSFIVYGDGKARANANFENGLIRLQGIYINNDGHISSDKYIQDADKYHNFSYIVNTEHDFIEYKKSFKEVFHPAGMKPFIIKTTYVEDSLAVNANSSVIKVININETSFNVSNGSNTLISTNVSIDLTATVNVGDTIILTGMGRTLLGTANIANTSNIVSGNMSNYIGDLNDGDLVIFSTDPEDIANTNYIVSNETVILRPNTNDITPVFTSDLIKYCSGQYVPYYFKEFIEYRVGIRSMGDIVNEGYIGLNSALAAVLYQQNIDIPDTQESWINDYIIPYLESDVIYSDYIINRPTAQTSQRLYFVSDTVSVDGVNQFTIGNTAPVTANNLYVKLIYTDVAEVTNVSATQIIISHNMQATSNNISGIIHKTV